MAMHSYLEVETTARAIAQRPDVSVSFSNSSTAYVKYEDDRFKINLPLSAQYSDRTIALMRGYLDHELGHVRYTPKSFISSGSAVATISRLVRSKGFPVNLTDEFFFQSFAHNVWNTLEDTRIEGLMSQDYPGSRFNLLLLNRELFPNDVQATIRTGEPVPTSAYPDILQDATNYLLRACMGRLHHFDAGDRGIGETIDTYPQAIQDLIHDIDAIVDAAIAPGLTSYGVLELSARYILRLKAFFIEHNDDQQQAGQPQQSGQSGQQGGQQDGQSGQSGQSGDEQQDEQQSGQSGQSGQQSGDSQSQAGSSGAQQGSGGGSGMSGSLMEEMTRQLEEASTSFDMRTTAGQLLANAAYADVNDLPQEEQNKLMQEIAGQHQLSIEMGIFARDMQGREVFDASQLSRFSNTQSRARMRERALAIQHSTAGMLQRLFQSATQVRSHPSEFTGRLNCSALYRTAVGDRRVFLSRAVRQKNNCRIIFLLDISGSMFNAVADCSTVIWGMRQATRSVPGVRSAVYAYHSGGIFCMADWNENSTYDEPCVGDSTPTGAALQYVRRFFPADDSRKVVFLCTDGYADSSAALKHSLRVMERAHVEVYGIGIGDMGSMCVKDFFDEAHCATSTNTASFAQALRAMLTTMARAR